MAERRNPTSPARLIAVCYGFFVVAAGARSAVQIASEFDVAPLAFVLSAVSAGIYCVGLAAFIAAERDDRWRPYAIALCLTELGGVVLIGLASVLFPSAFPQATVWSRFGSGYAFVPIALPLGGLLTCLCHERG